MTQQLTAREARRLSKKSDPDTHVNEILGRVAAAAEKGETWLKTCARDFGAGALYSGNPNDVQQAVMTKLKLLGYKVFVVVEERSFVDIWLKVDWSE